MEVLMGIYDAPEKQEQPLFSIDPLRTNIAVFGSAMSGKTTFLKTFLLRLHEQHRQEQEEIYIIDFGGNMGSYSKLPNICAYFDNTSEENIKRVFRTVKDRMDTNGKILQGKSYPEIYRKSPEECPPHLTFVIENINAFLADERYESYREELTKLCRDGLSKGLTVVITGVDLSGMGRLLTNFAQKIGLSLNADSYTELFGTRVHSPMRLPGRGVANIGTKYYEVQCFLPFEGEEENEILPLLTGTHPKRMTAFDRELTADNLDANAVDDGVAPETGEVLVGLDYYEHKPVRVNFDRNRYIGIYGKRGFGKTNLLRVLLQGLRDKYPESTFVYLDDGRQQLRRVMLSQLPHDKQEALQQTDREMEVLSKEHMLVFGNEIYLRNINQLRNFLYLNRLTTKQPTSLDRLNMQPLMSQPSKIVFVIDNKSAYPNVINDIHPVAQSVSDSGHIIILADIRPMEREYSDKLGRTMDIAFLLDNIGEFVADRGSKSVFGEMNEKELKMLYARCEVGDGYCYRIDSDELIKMKFLKAGSQSADRRTKT